MFDNKLPKLLKDYLNYSSNLNKSSTTINEYKYDLVNFLKYMTPNELEKYLSRFVHTKNVYYLGEDYIGEMTLKESLERINMGAICIIYCGNGIGYYQGEEDQGHRPRCLLKDVTSKQY